VAAIVLTYIPGPPLPFRPCDAADLGPSTPAGWQVMTTSFESHVAATCPGMLVHVGEAFAHDAVQCARRVSPSPPHHLRDLGGGHLPDRGPDSRVQATPAGPPATAVQRYSGADRPPHDRGRAGAPEHRV